MKKKTASHYTPMTITAGVSLDSGPESRLVLEEWGWDFCLGFGGYRWVTDDN